MQTEQTKINPFRVTVENVKNLFGRKSGSFLATLGETGWKAFGTCKQGAIEQLHADLVNAERNLQTRKYVRKGLVTFALYYAGGWQYDIIRDDGGYSAIMITSNSYNDAVQRMLEHVAQHEGI
jgi:hypothetical protein